ncbi:MAG: MFS transporter [Clostridia bacterium]|nr:MFS transporter [Clostridia bacterium]
MQPSYRRARAGCYFANIAMAAVCCLSPLLFVTFHEQYGISYTLLGLLSVVCFGVQLSIDLIFSFFARFFNIHVTVRATGLFAFVGSLIYAILPPLFPEHAYVFLVIGTLIFSVSAGLCEVLISPVIAAIPSDNPEREMSRLHSIYGWGVVSVVIVGTLLLKLFGTDRWYLMALVMSLVPLVLFLLFARAELPPVQMGGKDGKGGSMPRGVLLCMLCIFLGGATECTMTTWCSSYLETALGIPKTVGDVCGLALFAFLLGIGRTIYAKRGRHIERVLTLGMAGSAISYLIAALSPFPALGLVGCVLTGFCCAMLWPGTLIMMEKHYTGVGVVGYALMAAGGDAGGSVGPQIVGAVVDGVIASDLAPALAERLSVTVDQLGMKVGILTASLFPILGFFLLLGIQKAVSAGKVKKD